MGERSILRGMSEPLTIPAPNAILTIEVSAKDERAMREAAMIRGLDVLTFIQNAISRAVIDAFRDGTGE